MTKKHALFIAVLFFSINAFSQGPLRTIDLKNQKPSWQAVIGGEAISPCVETSYGIAVVSDGRLLSACTNNGNVIWQRAVKGRPSKFISSFGDFLYFVTGSSNLNFINPSGMTVWSAVCPFEITSNPLPGKDGRVFVKGKKGIACYGLNGKRKWYHETQALSELPLSQLSDGSVIAYLSQPVNGRTVAKRYSPFGKELEDLTFAQIVACVENCQEGVLVSLKNGSLGLITVQGDKADTKWVCNTGLSQGAFSIAYKKQNRHAAYFFQAGQTTKAFIINVNDGKLINQFPVGNMNCSNLKYSKSTSSGFFLSGSISACEFYEDGSILWAASLPDKRFWNELCYTGENYLIFCQKDWSMNSYKMNSLPGKISLQNPIETVSLVKVKEMNDISRQFNLHFLNEDLNSEIIEKYQKDDVGLNEEDYLSAIKSEANAYLASLNSQVSYRNEQNYYKSNPVFTQNLLYLMSQAGTADFHSLFAKILTSETDSQLLSITISYAGEEGFDPDGHILQAFEYLMLNKLLPRDTSILMALCDSTYDVCSFMGRPAFNKQGKNIISRLMFPQYNKETRDYARKTLEKMILLEK